MATRSTQLESILDGAKPGFAAACSAYTAVPKTGCSKIRSAHQRPWHHQVQLDSCTALNRSRAIESGGGASSGTAQRIRGEMKTAASFSRVAAPPGNKASRRIR